MSRQALIHGCQRITDTLEAYNPDLHIRAGAARSESEDVLVTTGGLCHTYDRTHWSLTARAQRTEGTDMVFVSFGRDWNDLDLYDPDVISGQILDDLRCAETIVPATPGPTTILLSPQMLARFIAVVGKGTNGRNVAKGDSPLRGRIGARVLDPCLTIVDDPHRDYDSGAASLSNDGVATRRTPLFDRGVLQAFLYDLDTAAMVGTTPTGHNNCAPYALDVAPGTQSSQDMIASIRDGLYVKHPIGFGQGNILNGDFSFNVALGFVIHDGRIVGRVKNTMLAGNIYDLLQRDVQLSSDRDPVLRMPYALLQGAQVSGAKS
jgi:PmbA protein